ncbi:response regulator [Klebsiella variicola subsp. variicola]|nr:response regulator [Klebsiella variicola subsp. variicola]
MATNHAPASAPLTQADSHKLPMTVMAVDDNPANLKLIGALLDDLVQQVILCDSGQQAVDQAKRLQMDLILMDIQMPDMDGIRACELIHHLSHHQQTPVIAVTAHAPGGPAGEAVERRHERLSGEANRRRETARSAAALSARPAQRRSGGATARRAGHRP